MKKISFFRPVLLALSLILSFTFLLIGIGMEEFYEIAGNALTL